MAVPTPYDLITIVAEALFKAGYDSPTTAQQNRGEDKFMEEIKNDIWRLGKKLKPLHTIAYDVTVKGQDTYPLPTDYASDMSLTLLTGTVKGTAQGGASGSITLAAADTATEGRMLGKYILVTANTGVDGCRQCNAYNSTTKVASVSPNFDTAPDNTSTYLRIDQNFPIAPIPLWDIDKQSFPMNRERPSNYAPVGDSDDGEVKLFPTPDGVHGLQFRYYADLMELDLTGTLMATLYKRWSSVFIQGVYAKQLQSDAVSSDRVAALHEIALYREMLEELIEREKYTHDISDVTVTTNG